MKHAQEVGLHLLIHIRDLIEEEGPLVGQPEEAGSVSDRTGERPLLVSEELARQELGGQGAAVDGHKRLLFSLTARVYGAGGELLAGARGAEDVDRHVGERDAVYHAEHLLHGHGLAHNAPLAKLLRGVLLGLLEQCAHAAQLDLAVLQLLFELFGEIPNLVVGSLETFTLLAVFRDEASRLQHDYIGTEHLLLGIVREGEGIAAKVLGKMDLDFEQIQQAVENMVKSSGGTLTIANTINVSEKLYSLCWLPQLPDGWRLVSVSGDGNPELGQGGILWTGSLPEGPINMDYTVEVPLWAIGVEEIRGQANYYCRGMKSAAGEQATPSPLALAPRDSDSDGMPDTWEQHHGGDATAMTAAADEDGDGICDTHGVAPGEGTGQIYERGFRVNENAQGTPRAGRGGFGRRIAGQ